MQHLRRADAVHQLQPGRGLPRLEGGQRQQRFSGRHAFAQARDVVVRELRQHRTVGRGRGEADRRPDAPRWPAAACRAARPPAAPPRRRCAAEEHEPAQPEGEGERRRADEAVGRQRLQHVAAVGVAIASRSRWEMHRALRFAGGAGREADEADVVAGRVHRFEPAVSRVRGEGVELPALPRRRPARHGAPDPPPSASRRRGGRRKARGPPAPWRADRRAPSPAASAWLRSRSRPP